MPTYNFLCGSGHVTEQRRGFDTTSAPCLCCGELAMRQFSATGQYIIGDTVANGKAVVPKDERRYDLKLFQEAGAMLEHEHKKAEEIAQRPLKSDNLWQRGKRKADAIRAGTAPPLMQTCVK